MKTVVLAGATGVVGSRALEHLLGHEEVGRVVALGRRPPARQHPKLVSQVVDFADASALSAAMPDDVAVALCALGTTMKKAGSRAAFRAVDLEAVGAFAAAARRNGAKRFLLVSSLGADPASANFYLRTKGEAEAAVGELGYPQVTIVRPSFIDDEGARTERRLGERLALPVARALFRFVGHRSRYAPVTAETIARALVRSAFDTAAEPVRVIESDRIHQLGR